MGKEPLLSARHIHIKGVVQGVGFRPFVYNLAAELSLGPILKAKLVKSASGKSLRPVVEAKLTLADKEFKTDFTIADRAEMKYRVLIGQNILRKGFLIDPAKEIPKGR